MKSKNRIFLICFFLIFMQYDLFPASRIQNEKCEFNIAIRPGVKVSTTIDILINNRNQTNGKHIICLHGFVHTANTFRSWMKRVIKTSDGSQVISSIILIDLPGRGNTSVPEENLLFGELDLYDYATYVFKVLKRLKQQGIPYDSVVTHSMGTMLIQIIQNQLIQQQTTLFDRFNIDRVLFLAPVLPNELPWNFADSGTGLQVIAQYEKKNQKFGSFIKIPAGDWINLFFSDSQGNVVSDAPSKQRVKNKNYLSRESLIATKQLLGDPQFNIERPSIARNIFQNTGSILYIASFSKDTSFFELPKEHKKLYRYLTGDTTFNYFTMIRGVQAIHDTYILKSIQLNYLLLSFLKN